LGVQGSRFQEMSAMYIIERLRRRADDSENQELDREAIAEIERLRAGIQAFLDGDYEPKVKKIDKCPHGVYGYDACEACIEQHFYRLLSPDAA
jgi:hypothetical protein